MVDLVPLLATVLPIVAAGLLFLVIIVNIFVKIRRKFSISVNCWFCNSWMKVPYDDRNSFNCPTCTQYNGFTMDGDYNKNIPEQHDELMNRSQRVKTEKTVTSNGLCILCNNNQQLKIFQLASFVPLVEENYDVEIEHFQEQLEKAYKLCKKCDKVLKKTLNKQNAWIFGNRLKKMCSNGISKVADQLGKEARKMLFFSKVDGFLSVLLVSAVIFTTILGIKVFTESLATYVPPAYLVIYKKAVAGLNKSRTLEFHFHPYITKNVKVEAYFLICGLGLSFQVFKLITGHIRGATKANNLLCWVILFLVSWVRSTKGYYPYILFIQAFCCTYLLLTAFTKVPNQKSPSNRKSMRKLVKNLENTCTDFSESSDFEDISTSSKNCESLQSSSVYVNRSVCSSLDVPQPNTAGNVLNTSFVPAQKKRSDVDLSKSLNNLHLGRMEFRAPQFASVKRPKPVLSPPKFQTVNSWVAGGFWKNSDRVLSPVPQRTDISRSSSESSGFGSQHNEFVPTRNNFFEDFDRMSLHGDFSRVSPTNFGFTSPEFRRIPNFYHNQFHRVGSPLFKLNEPYQRARAENWSDRISLQPLQSFHDLSLQNS